MKITYLSGAYVPSRGANSMHVMRMCQALANLGHNVTLQCYAGYQSVDDDYDHYGVASNFRLLKIKRPQVRIWGAVCSALKMRAAVLQEPLPELVYAREFWSLLLISRLRIPFIFESHWKPKTVFHKAVESAIMRHPCFRRIVLISEELKKIYQKEYPWLSEDKMVVAHDGADICHHAITDHTKASDTLQVGYVGSFFPGNGINLIEQLARRMQDVKFHIIGGDPQRVVEYKQRNSDLANITFHGFVAPSDLPNYYAKLDILLAPYQFYGPSIQWCSPMKLFEYMAHGKPIICSDFPVMREILTHGKNGLLIPADDLTAWVGSISSLKDNTYCESIGQAALARLEKDFTWDIRAKRVLDNVKH